jgi:SM-20-related protein
MQNQVMDTKIIADHLKHSGYIVLKNAIPDTLASQLFNRCGVSNLEHFQAAQIGRGENRTLNLSIRGDTIHWLSESNQIDLAYLSLMETLRLDLNKALFLGLFDYESHYAIYDVGAAYAKHSDVLIGKNSRILSTVFYLNEHWQSGDGGELRLFDPNGDKIIATINPSFGTMIIFLSDCFPHEVLASQKRRCSIAGWFRGSQN